MQRVKIRCWCMTWPVVFVSGMRNGFATLSAICKQILYNAMQCNALEQPLAASPYAANLLMFLPSSLFIFFYFYFLMIKKNLNHACGTSFTMWLTRCNKIIMAYREHRERKKCLWFAIGLIHFLCPNVHERELNWMLYVIMDT